MADISKITAIDGTTYDIKDAAAMQFPYLRSLGTKTYTNVIATANDNNGAGFFYLRVRGNTYNDLWHVKVRVHATVPGNIYYDTETIFDLWATQATYCSYKCHNIIFSTSYRPIYYNSYFRPSATGYNNGVSGYIGFNLYYSTNPTNASYKRTVVVDLLEYSNCEVELLDELITPTNIPNRATHTNWYTSTNTSYDNFDACSHGFRFSGDANTTSISNLYFYNGNFQANSIIYRYQMLFQTDENNLTPLNNVNNGYNSNSKEMLTSVEFDPFGIVLYYNTTTTINPGSNIGQTACFYGFSGCDLRYTFNCGTSLTAHKPVYVVVTPLSNGKCKLANSVGYSQTLPTTEDGNWYILLGRAYSTYQMALYPYHPVYRHDGTKIVEVTPAYNEIQAKYTKPSTGIPASDLASGVIPDVSGYAPIANPAFTGSISLGRMGSSLDTGTNSTAIGYNVYASGQYSFAQGTSSQATGYASHAQNGATQATGDYASAEGFTTVASGDESHAQGFLTIANHQAQNASGTYNVADPSTAASTEKGNYVEIVGNGTSSSARSNAYALDWDGTGHFAGDVYVGCNNDSTGGTKLMKTPTTAGTAGQVLTSDGNGGQSWQTPSGGTVTDVQVNGTSVLSGGVANVDISGKMDKASVSGAFYVPYVLSNGNIESTGIKSYNIVSVGALFKNNDKYPTALNSYSEGEYFAWNRQNSAGSATIYQALTDIPYGTTLTIGANANVKQVENILNKLRESTVRCDLGTISSLPVTKTFNGVTSDMTVTHYEVGTPKAFASALTITTADNTITISGTMTSGSSSTLVVTLSATTDLTEST